MFKKECVKIEVKGNEEGENLPIECCTTRNGKPSQSHFIFRPRVFPQLSNYVLNLNWNSVSKTIKVDFNETPNRKKLGKIDSCPIKLEIMKPSIPKSRVLNVKVFISFVM